MRCGRRRHVSGARRRNWIAHTTSRRHTPRHRDRHDGRAAATSDRKAAMSDLATFVARTDATAPVRRRWRHVLLHSLTRPIYALYGRRLLAQVRALGSS